MNNTFCKSSGSQIETVLLQCFILTNVVVGNSDMCVVIANINFNWQIWKTIMDTTNASNCMSKITNVKWSCVIAIMATRGLVAA